MRLLALALLLPSLALSQGLNPTAPGQSSGGKVLASFPLTTSGPLITEDANTVAHVYWNGTALTDTKGNAWTMNGTVPQVTANPFTTTRYGAGPFSDSNYYSLGTGSDVLDFAGDFTCHLVFNPTTLDAANARRLLVNASTSTGYALTVRSTAASQVEFTVFRAGPASATATIATAPTIAGPNVVSIGRSGNTNSIKMNLSATGTSTAAMDQDSATVAKIGSLGTSTRAFDGTIYEVICSSSPFVEATVVSTQQKVLGHYDGSSALAVTRATNATYAPRSADPSTLFTAAPGVARITDSGIQIEGSRTNYALQSNTMSTGTAATSPWTLAAATVATVAGGVGGGTWAEVTSTTSAGIMYQTATSASATTFVASAWAAKASGTGYASVKGMASSGTAGTTVSACSCIRSDGGVCTATKVTSDRQCMAEVSDLGTTPVRISAIFTTSAASTDPVIYAIPGQIGTSTGTTRFSGAQLEVGTYPTSLIVSTSTSVLRASDAVSATVPAVPANRWCWAITALPEEGRAWSGLTNQNTLLHLGDNVVAADNSIWDATRYLVRDSAAGFSIYTNSAHESNVAHRLVSCNNAGTVTMSSDGAAVSLTKSGAGTGLQATMPTTLRIGTQNTAGSEFGGFVKNVSLWKASKTKEVK
jgi:hypothetical protein